MGATWVGDTWEGVGDGLSLEEYFGEPFECEGGDGPGGWGEVLVGEAFELDGLFGFEVVGDDGIECVD